MIVTDLSEFEAPGGAFLPDKVSVLVSREPLIIELDGPIDASHATAAAERIAHLPAPTILVGSPQHVPRSLTVAVDICLTEEQDPPRPWVRDTAEPIALAVAEQPMASLSLVTALRAQDQLSIPNAIAVESATYALLLASRGFRDWLARRGPPHPKPHSGPFVTAEVTGDRLEIWLDRPEARNAINTNLRDELVAALRVAQVDRKLNVEIRGRGTCFSAGGDLEEFGEVGDPGVAHAVRLTTHPGAAVGSVSERTTCFVHGPCVGAGIEIPAFAATVVADPGATFCLPEARMGLIPGAGGTVSLARRIGRQRTAWLALGGAALDAATAFSWGLVDRVEKV